jgi:hypothetical protein
MTIDRVNNSRGYTPDNVVPACDWCNGVKNSFWTYGEMTAPGIRERLQAEHTARIKRLGISVPILYQFGSTISNPDSADNLLTEQ